MPSNNFRIADRWFVFVIAAFLCILWLVFSIVMIVIARDATERAPYFALVLPIITFWIPPPSSPIEFEDKDRKRLVWGNSTERSMKSSMSSLVPIGIVLIIGTWYYQTSRKAVSVPVTSSTSSLSEVKTSEVEAPKTVGKIAPASKWSSRGNTSSYTY